MPSSNRLLKDFGELKKDNQGSFILCRDENNIHSWKGKLRGPFGTPYQVRL